jgi:hypothetical protein
MNEWMNIFLIREISNQNLNTAVSFCKHDVATFMVEIMHLIGITDYSSKEPNQLVNFEVWTLTDVSVRLWSSGLWLHR